MCHRIEPGLQRPSSSASTTWTASHEYDQNGAIMSRMQSGPAPAGERHKLAADVESFYHLPHDEHEGKACQGTACFAARHLNPQLWAEASAQNPRVYCLGECFASPVKGQTHPRPPVKVFSKHAVVLGRVAAGGARTLAEYKKT